LGHKYFLKTLSSKEVNQDQNLDEVNKRSRKEDPKVPEQRREESLLITHIEVKKELLSQK